MVTLLLTNMDWRNTGLHNTTTVDSMVFTLNKYIKITSYLLKNNT